MPIIGSAGSLSAKGYGMFSSGGIYWLMEEGWTPFPTQRSLAGSAGPKSIAVDGSGNLFMCDGYYGPNAKFMSTHIMKFNTLGVLQWQKALEVPGSFNSSEMANGVVVDSSGNAYITGYTTNSNFSLDAITAKYSSSGTLLWQRRYGLTTPSTHAEQSNSIAIDNTGSVYIAGLAGSSSTATRDAFITKYNTNGALQWQVYFGNIDDQLSTPAIDVATDISGNAHIVTRTAIDDISIAKYSTSGQFLWKTALGGTSVLRPNSIATDSSSNVYIVGSIDVSTANPPTSGSAYIAKFNSSGALQWQKRLDLTNYVSGANTLHVDSVGNVYMGGSSLGFYNNNFLPIIVKFNPAGEILWQRLVIEINKNGGSGIRSIVSDNSGNLLVRMGNFNFTGILKIPSDGSKIGQYPTSQFRTLSYEPTTFIANNASASVITSNLVSSTANLSDSAGDLIEIVSDLPQGYVYRIQ
jgi:hypothetical protein